MINRSHPTDPMRNRVCTSLLAAMTLLSACSSDRSAAGGATTGGTIIVSTSADAGSLFPLLVNDETGRSVTDLLFDHLAEIGDGLGTVGDEGFSPRLAKSWNWSKDSMSIAFHIDPAARFHDGIPVRASDVRYSYKLIVDPAVGATMTPLVANIDSVSVPDSLTATVWYKKRTPEQFYDAAYQIPIVPEHVYGKVKPADMNASDVLRNPVGSGRFRLAKWEPTVRIELVADTSNYRGRAKVDRVVFVLNLAPAAAATSVLTAQSDFYISFPIDQVPRLDSSTIARAIPNRQLGYGFLGMNVHERKSKTRLHPILSDKSVRRAFSMALDRASMLSNVFNRTGIPAHGPFPADVATADTTLRLPAYDTTAAKALLDSAGWKPGTNGIRQKNGRLLSIELMVPSSSAIRTRYAELVQEQLKLVGAQIELSKVPFPTFLARHDAGDFDALLTAENVDPSVNAAKQLWTTSGIKAGTDYLGYATPRVDALLDSAALAMNPAAAKAYARRAYQLIADDVPAIWLYSLATTAAANRRIDVQPFRADGWWAHLADWSIPADKRIDRDRIGLRPQTP